MEKTKHPNVYLDMTHLDAAMVLARFPSIAAVCAEFDLDITSDRIPVRPGAHYMMGGVTVDTAGRTTLPGLWAAGEVTSSGLHGANRLASNSLLEAVVYAHLAADTAGAASREMRPMPAAAAWDPGSAREPTEEVVVSHNWDELRRFMWDYVGIVRTDKRLERAMHRIELLQAEIREYYSNFRVNGDLIELRNLVMVAELIVRSAMLRKESRGLHYTLDYPESLPDEKKHDTLLSH